MSLVKSVFGHYVEVQDGTGATTHVESVFGHYVEVQVEVEAAPASTTFPIFIRGPAHA